MSPLGRTFLGGLLSAVVMAETLRGAADVVLDFDRQEQYAQTIEANSEAGWAIRGAAVYDPTDQSLRVEGVYRSTQGIEPESLLSYRIRDENGAVLVEDGARFDWTVAADGSLESRFDLVIPQVSEEPLRTSWVVEFNAVMEGEYWYRDEFPDIGFAHIAFRNLPPRDHYTAVATWVPGYLPAGFKTRIPAWFRVGGRDQTRSGFQPSLDLLSVDELTKIRSARLDFVQMAEGTFYGWMPLGAQVVGPLLVRPGMVWDGVRWYEAPDWFERERVQFVSPAHYVLGAALVGGFGLWGWLSLGRIPWPAARWLGGVVLGGATLWWAGNLMISGFWPALLSLLMAWGVMRSRWLPSRASAYVLAWLFMVWVEVYWGRLDGIAGMTGSALVFSAATWAVLLLPLVAIRSAVWRYGMALAITAIWWFATVLGVAYFEFFQDFPSVGDLLYAGQIGQLGDSVGTLLGPRHWLPLWVWALMVGAASLGARFSGKPKSKTRNT